MRNIYDQFKDLSPININIKFNDACSNGQLDIILHVLTSPEIRKNFNTCENQYYALNCASYVGHLDIVKYLLTSPELAEHRETHANIYTAFRGACEGLQLDVIQYLIFDLNLQRIPSIDSTLEFCPEELVNKVENMFAIRELNKKLSDSLSVNEISKNKIKI